MENLNNNSSVNNIMDPPRYREDSAPKSTPGINSPEIVPPAFNPPVPNRAWTAMINGKDIEELTQEERRELYLGKDNII